ncbi:hypothetical protein HZI73_16185 [Vallitalea pronyensis]|uniref:Uncharacterized protein n=1 Tax=Vallitalea pronyensis TaxID=1348613 RepID=A0A8J8MLJ5_9FIRM|nr:hypothetical protein [Vallitalea pronyensis]QUI23736.1 hypothetical protein HZI73_16185 [Vallitalea pronyensis]
MKKIENKNYDHYNADPTRSILMNTYNYEIGIMMPDDFLVTNTDVEKDLLQQSDMVQNDLNGEEFLDDQAGKDV